MHDALVGLGGELDRRLTLTDAELAAAPRLIVSTDSANHALHQLARCWKTLGAKGDPATSPPPRPSSMRCGPDARPA